MATQVKTKGYIRTEQLDKKSSACGCSGIDGFSNLDGSSPRSEILEFQKFAESKGAKLVKGWKSKITGHVFKAGDPFVIDGSWGENTQAAWDIYGKDYEAAKLAISPKDKQQENKPDDNKSEPVIVKKTGTITEKWKSLSTTKKALVIGGGLLVTTGIIVLIWKLIPKK